MDTTRIILLAISIILILGGLFYIINPTFLTSWDKRILKKRFNSAKLDERFFMAQKMKAVMCLAIGVICGIVALIGVM